MSEAQRMEILRGDFPPTLPRAKKRASPLSLGSASCLLLYLLRSQLYLKVSVRTSYPAPASSSQLQVLVSYPGSRPLTTSRYLSSSGGFVLYLVFGLWGVPLFSCRFLKKDILFSVCRCAVLGGGFCEHRVLPSEEMEVLGLGF